MHYICALETPSIAFNANPDEKESRFNNSRAMEILKDTFEQKLPLVAEAIEQCDFLAIDAEFTGTVHFYAKSDTACSRAETEFRLTQVPKSASLSDYSK
jgi:hypothetical protein